MLTNALGADIAPAPASSYDGETNAVHLSTLPSARFRPKRYRPDGQGFWSGHLPFAADLVGALRPSVLVELGTYYGESYFGFCQAIHESGVACRCYAVDTWDGDPNTGRYSETVFETVAAHNAENYASFSSLLRMTFDDARGRLADRSIDLLHLDGWHSYEAVKHDFETWLPKVSAGGVILIHDIAVHEDGFGAWRFWEEVSRCFPSFEFLHSCGLGLLVNGNAKDVQSPLLSELISRGPESEEFREYYAFCAERLARANRRVIANGMYRCQVFSPDGDRYSEERSVAVAISAGQWLDVDLQVPVPDGRLRVDPVNYMSAIEISEMTVEDGGRILWRLDSRTLPQIDVGGTAVRVQDENRLVILSCGDDPQLYLPAIEASELTGQWRLRCRIHVDTSFDSIQHSLDTLGDLLSILASIRGSLSCSTSELGRKIVDLHASYLRLSSEQSDMRMRLDSSDVQLKRALSQLSAVHQSFSWRLTAPLRRVGSLLLSRRN